MEDTALEVVRNKRAKQQLAEGKAGKIARVPLLPPPSRQDIKFLDNRMFVEGSPMKQGNGVPLMPTPSPLIANNNYMQQVENLIYLFSS